MVYVFCSFFPVSFSLLLKEGRQSLRRGAQGQLLAPLFRVQQAGLSPPTLSSAPGTPACETAFLTEGTLTKCLLNDGFDMIP